MNLNEEMSIVFLLWGFLIKTFSFSRFILFYFTKFICKNYDDDDVTYITLHIQEILDF